MQFHPEFSSTIMRACLPDGSGEVAGVMEGKDWARELLTTFWQQTRPSIEQAQGA